MDQTGRSVPKFPLFPGYVRKYRTLIAQDVSADDFALAIRFIRAEIRRGRYTEAHLNLRTLLDPEVFLDDLEAARQWQQARKPKPTPSKDEYDREHAAEREDDIDPEAAKEALAKLKAQILRQGAPAAR